MRRRAGGSRRPSVPTPPTHRRCSSRRWGSCRRPIRSSRTRSSRCGRSSADGTVARPPLRRGRRSVRRRGRVPAVFVLAARLPDVLGTHRRRPSRCCPTSRATPTTSDCGPKRWIERTGEALGNFPQAFTHMAHITSCLHLEAARDGEIDFDVAHDYAEHAVDRLLASGRRLAPSGATAPRRRRRCSASQLDAVRPCLLERVFWA